MFPISVLAHLDAAVPSLNPVLANGLAVEHLRYVEKYIDDVFRVVAGAFPPGMTYDGCRRCTPIKEYAEATKKKGNRSAFDVARSDIYLVEYKFSYLGEVLQPKFLYLPFVSKAGTIHLGGSRFVISPVLSDRVITIGMTNVFLRLLKAKLIINRTTHHYVASGEQETVEVAWSNVYNERVDPNSPKATVVAECTLMHYLLCKYGLTEAFWRFGQCVPVVGDESEVNDDTHPSAQWVICHSRQIKPKGFGKFEYAPSGMRLAILREQYTPMVKNLVAGFFYVVDHFPARVLPKAEYYNSTRLWQVLLGHLIWSGNAYEGTLYTNVQDHIASLDEYVDSLMLVKLEDAGYPCQNIYELFALVLIKMDVWLLTGDDRVNTMYDKELDVLSYVCRPITEAIVKLYFKLKSAQKKELNAKKINKIMDMNIKPGVIFRIRKEHGEVTTTTTSGDNMALKITNLLVPQSASSRNRNKKDRVAISDPAKRLHASVAEVGCYLGLPKSEPTGRSRLNLALQISPSGQVLRNPEFADLLDATQLRFKR
jgi:hypothetical protein